MSIIRKNAKEISVSNQFGAILISTDFTTNGEMSWTHIKTLEKFGGNGSGSSLEDIATLQGFYSALGKHIAELKEVLKDYDLNTNYNGEL